eukprot:366208-Chlamydomonas_euryale.AAC.6
MEWVEDVRLFEVHGPGSEINYQIASPLAADLRDTMLAAAGGGGGGGWLGGHGDSDDDGKAAPHARMLFAHAETVVPAAALLGLLPPPLRGSSGGGKAASDAFSMPARRLAAGGGGGSGGSARVGAPRDEPYAPPFGPDDAERPWRAGRVSPYGANLAAVLYRARRSAAGGGGLRSEFLVRFAYNEQVVRLPGCSDGAGLECGLEDFLRVVSPLADSGAFERICTQG